MEGFIMIQAIAQTIAHAAVVIVMLILIAAFLGQIIHDTQALYRAAFGKDVLQDGTSKNNQEKIS